MSERNPGKQRRAAQNKAAREALATRTTKAKQQQRPPTKRGEEESRPARSARRSRNRAAAAPSAVAQRPSRSSATSSPPLQRGRAAKGRDGRPARTANAVPVRQANNGVSGVIAEVQAVPGGKGIFFALLFSIVAALLILCVRVAPQQVMQHVGDLVGRIRAQNKLPVPEGLHADKAVYAQEYALVVFGPLAVAIAVIPVIITGCMFVLARKDNRRRNFTLGAGAMFLFVIGLAGPLSIYFLFSFGGLVYAAYKIRQVEPPPERPVRARSARRRPAGADDDPDVGEDESATDEESLDGEE